jgi:hypothetical protein
MCPGARAQDAGAEHIAEALAEQAEQAHTPPSARASPVALHCPGTPRARAFRSSMSLILLIHITHIHITHFSISVSLISLSHLLLFYQTEF